MAQDPRVDAPVFAGLKPKRGSSSKENFQYAEIYFEETRTTSGCLFVPEDRLSNPVDVLKAMILCFDCPKPNIVLTVAGQSYRPSKSSGVPQAAPKAETAVQTVQKDVKIMQKEHEMKTFERETVDGEQPQTAEQERTDNPLATSNAGAGNETDNPLATSNAGAGNEATSYLEWFDAVKDDDVLRKMWAFDDPSSRLPRCFGRAPSDDEVAEQVMMQRRRFGQALVDTVSVICEEVIVPATAGQGAAWVMTPADRTSCMQLLGDGLAKCGSPKYTWIGEIQCDSGIVTDEDGSKEYGGIIRHLRLLAAVVDETSKKPPHVSDQVVYQDQSAFFPSGVGPVCCCSLHSQHGALCWLYFKRRLLMVPNRKCGPKISQLGSRITDRVA
jgi:hypothetical protein